MQIELKQSLDNTVQYLKGVGPKRAGLLSKIGIETIKSLLNYFPREYDDRRSLTKISNLKSCSKVTVCGKIISLDTSSFSGNLSILQVGINDGTGTAFGVFYRKSNPYHKHDVFINLRKEFAVGNQIVLNGFCEYSFGKKQIKVEEFEVIPANDSNEKLSQFLCIMPVYPLTEGISQKWIRELIKNNLEKYADQWPEIISEKIKEKNNFMPSNEALREIHFPSDFSKAEQARKRLAFDEFFMIELAFTLMRSKIKESIKPHFYKINKNFLTPFRENLNFEFTLAQKKVINEIFTDMQSIKPMNRLLMGDVGSGKTVVALSSILLAIENNYQAVLLAPTEILAEQHYSLIEKMLSKFSIKTALLTSKVSKKKKEKEKLINDLAEGRINLLVGTHAILEKNIQFKNLALAVIDEQHRFGVMQRAALFDKTGSLDILLMTATPIPRSLALTIYGDMDISVIDSLPPGRVPIETLYMGDSQAYELVKNEVKNGHQAFIVYPLIEESDKIELKAAVKEAEKLSSTVFDKLRVGLIHGQMAAEEKERVMQDFRSGAYNVLIATTVIEVGIDVPNATVMVIEHADRFGLAALHQLRGRIGRGASKSYCVLLGSPKSEDAKKRFQVMLSTNNGFKIAEEDLALRGPGEFFGTAQHGVFALKAGNLTTDYSLIELAKTSAREIVNEDKELISPEHALIRAEILNESSKRFKLLRIG